MRPVAREGGGTARRKERESNAGEAKDAKRRSNALKAIAAVSDQTRVLLVGSVLTNTASFMIAPLLALYMQSTLHQPAASIGIVLMAQIVIQRALPVITGTVGDRWGLRRVLMWGILIRSIGFGSLIFARDLASLVVAAILVGVGGATITPSVKAMMMQAEHERRLEALTLRSLAVNAGAVGGPLLGALLFLYFQAALVVSALVYLGFFALIAGRVAPQKRPDRGNVPVLRSIATMARDRRLLWLTVGSAGFWFLYTQFTFTVPLYGLDRFGLGPSFGVLFAVNAVIVLSLQYKLITELAGRVTLWRVIAVGTSMLAIAFACLALMPTAVSLLAFTIIFSIGELLVIPALDSLASNISPTTRLGGYLGFVSLGWAVGGAMGNLLGGVLYSEARVTGTFALFWTINACVGLITASTFLLLGRLFGDASHAEA